MFLLRFTVENHKCFRDAVDLTLVEPRLQTQSPPPDGSWAEYTTRVAAIYGANASGKSCLLDGMRYMLAVIEHSATGWAQRKSLPRVPFALDEKSKSEPSSFALDFVLNEVRYEYGFSATEKRVESEWLYTYPNGRRKAVFDRGPGADAISSIRGLGTGGALLNKATGPRELVLSKGVLLKHPLLSEIAEGIIGRVLIANYGESDRNDRLRKVINDLADGSFTLDDLLTMLRVADIGIAGAEVEQGETDPNIKLIVKALMDAQETTSAAFKVAVDEVTFDENDEERIDQIITELARSLRFQHRGAGDRTYSLPSTAQSTGTLTWLSLAAPAIQALREGGVLAVDELDASLHPQLAQVMIEMFRDEEINAKNAQLIFTTHDTFFLSPTSIVQLTPDEVWMVEKDRTGVSDLFRLSDFPTRKGQNYSRRYLQGRYGATPSVAPSLLRSLVGLSNDDKDAELV